MNEGIGIAPGKCILLGEHAVVYGHPAIATAIDVFSKVRITKNPEKITNILFRDFSLNLT
jgi:mevalonate kinase